MTKFKVLSLKIYIYLTLKSLHFVTGYSAARDTNMGTPFVRAINDVFRAHAKSDDILSLLTRVGILVDLLF